MTLTSRSAHTVPDLGPHVGGWAVRAAFAAVALALSFIRYPDALWLACILLIALAVCVPRSLMAWVLILVLAASQIGHEPVWDVGFVVLLAGLHLLHVLAAPMLVIPVRARVQLSIFRRPLLRFLTIQVPVQAAAAAALLLWQPDSELAIPLAAVAGGVALVILTLTLIIPLLRDRPH